MTNKMWGGAFSQGPAELMKQANQSISVDQKLYAEDIQGSVVHVQMLAKQGIVTADEADKIIEGLKQIKLEIEAGQFDFKAELEDIHMNIEARLVEIVGPVAGKLHTARSRNDQVATDFKLYVRKQCEVLRKTLRQLQMGLVAKAEQHVETVMPGFTHLQVAQPISFGHYLMAYVEMFSRDETRLRDASTRADECPLGSCALAGTSFLIDRHYTADHLGFVGPTRNSIDSVSDRDFALEFLFACSMISLHLSRLAEEMILFSSHSFGFVKLPEQFSSGSSIMPQKRNPDSMELVRAKAGRVYGSLTSLFITMKGLPLAYNKDMQEDKRPVIDAAETILEAMQLTGCVIQKLSINEDKMLKAAGEGFSTATDLADLLVKDLKIPFREAHHLTGQIVKFAEAQQCGLHELKIDQFRQFVPEISDRVSGLFDARSSVESRDSYGGTAPARVREAISNFYARINCRF